MMGLTRRQADCLAIIRAYIAEHGCSPSYAELMGALGCRSKSTVARLLDGLKVRGHVDWTPRVERTLTLVERRAPSSLSPDLQNRLACFCAEHGEEVEDVIADAVLLHLDAFDTPRLPHVPLLRCDECDNGIDAGWTHCPFCGAQARNEGDEDAEALAIFGAAFDGGASP